MKKKLPRLILLLILSLTGLKGVCQERLLSRLTIVDTDRVAIKHDKTKWTPLIGAISKTNVAGEYIDYLPNVNSSCDVDVWICKTSVAGLNIDDHIQLEIIHGGITDVNFYDLSTRPNGWYSLGTFQFSNSSTDHIRLKRGTTDANKYTVSYHIRLDTHYPISSANQNNTPVNVGFTSNGSWTSSSQTGYRNADAPPKQSIDPTATAIWNPGQLSAGRFGVYIYNPSHNQNSYDKYEIFHNGQVSEVHLSDLKDVNLNIFIPSISGSIAHNTNPVYEQGWYKLGDFDFSGTGYEYIKLTKSTSDVTFADCIYIENVQLEGTIVNRTVITSNTHTGVTSPPFQQFTFDQKISASTSVIPGFSPYAADVEQTSSLIGGTIYSRTLYNTATVARIWNPCIIDPGIYDIYYYLFWDNPSGKFTLPGGAVISRNDLIKEKYNKIGQYNFTGNGNEFVKVETVARASDMIFEKPDANHSILKQVIVTTHPYFGDLAKDIKGIPESEDINFVVKNGFMPTDPSGNFSPDAPMTRENFILAMCKILKLPSEPSLPNFSDVTGDDMVKGYIAKAKSQGILFGIPPDTSKIMQANSIAKDEAAKIMFNAMESSGQLQNVKDFYDASLNLSNYTNNDKVSIYSKEAYLRMLDLEVISTQPAGSPTLDPRTILSRKSAAGILKLFYQNVICSGPPQGSDWEISLRDEFKGSSLDDAKWIAENADRYAPVCGRWSDNVLVAGGQLKLYNYMDNHGAYPYSSGSIFTRTKIPQLDKYFECRYKYPNGTYGSHNSFWVSPGYHPEYGDLNINEGSYPNHIWNNNLFAVNQTKPSNESERQFFKADNLAHDFHVYSAYLDTVNVYYKFDGEITYNEANYTLLPDRQTNVSSNIYLSSLITSFDGPLFRDRMDGTYAAFDWVRVYGKKTDWFPELVGDLSVPKNNDTDQPIDIQPVLKFNKPITTPTIAQVVITGTAGPVPSYKISKISSSRYIITFSQNLKKSTTYTIKVLKSVTDLHDSTMINDATLSFSTIPKATQTIDTFADLPAGKIPGDADFGLVATASSSLPVTFTSSNVNVATIVNNQCHIVSDGQVNIIASQDGNDDYNAAPAVSKTLTVYASRAYATNNIPGIIQAEFYDVGLNSRAYFDSTTGNTGTTAFRSGTDVDVLQFNGSEYKVQSITNGEWLAFTVNVTSSGNYKATAHYSYNYPNAGLFRVEFDGVTKANFSLASTGSWTTFGDAIGDATFFLDAGYHRMRIFFTNGGYHLDKITFESVMSSPSLAVMNQNKTVNTDEIKKEAVVGLMIYPNPVSGNELNLQTTLGQNTDALVTISSSAGIVTYRQTFNNLKKGLNTLNVRLPNLSPQTYIVTIQTKDGIKTGVLIKN